MKRKPSLAKWFRSLSPEAQERIKRDNPDLFVKRAKGTGTAVRGQKSALEDHLVQQVKLCQGEIPLTFKREFRFDATGKRRFRFDFAWVQERIAVEVQGGQWIRGGGRHQRGSSLDNEYTKLNLATSQGWRVYLFTTNMINDGTAVATLLEAFKQETTHND